LREEARQYRQAAKKETSPEIRRRLANHALALAQLAEKIEREEAGGIKRGQAGE
jgi:hypothetical protein